MVAQRPNSTLRELAASVGVTERSVSGILGHLQSAGYVSSERVGRGKVYVVDVEKSLRHPVVAVRSVRDLLECARWRAAAN